MIKARRGNRLTQQLVVITVKPPKSGKKANERGVTEGGKREVDLQRIIRSERRSHF